MEGTSGAAERALLRGRVCEAALPPGRRKPCRGRVARKRGTRAGSKGVVATPATKAASTRQEVSEPIGLGQSLRERAIVSKGAGMATPKTAGL